jgi:hypothetical protein
MFAHVHVCVCICVCVCVSVQSLVRYPQVSPQVTCVREYEKMVFFSYSSDVVSMQLVCLFVQRALYACAQERENVKETANDIKPRIQGALDELRGYRKACQ